MNALFYKLSPPTEKTILDTICKHLSLRQFNHAEQALLDHLKGLMHMEYNTIDDVKRALAPVKTLYLNFNDYYSNWASEVGLSLDDELLALKKDIHPNLLFAQMTDPESMDDLVYEVASFVSDNENTTQEHEAYYHLDCYTKSMSV